MKKYAPFVILVAIFATIGTVATSQATQAANKSDFNPGYIIDDSIFYNSLSMDPSQIQAFLLSKNPNCDYDGTQPASDWGRPDLTHAQLAQYIREGTNGYTKNSSYHAPPYRCLTKYVQDTPQMEAASGLCELIEAGRRTAAQIISAVGKACGINPQVLVILLQKEQSLVTDTWPLNLQLRNATGFACPDTAPCDPAYEGLFYQVYYAARQFKVYQAYPNNYNYRAGRNNNIYWHPDLSRCGSSTVYIQNQATAGLYIYTPYQPNQAALDNLYGLGDGCSSYGNRNFWRMFTDWFGATKGPAYAWKEDTPTKYYTDDSKQTQVDYNNIGRGQYFYVEYTVRNTGYQIWKKGTVLLGRNSSSPFCTSEWVACSRAAVVNRTSDVNPGESVTFGAWMRSPLVTGDYRIEWNLLIENVSWFADIGSHQNIKVTTTQNRGSLTQQKTFMRRGDNLYSPDSNTILSLRNTGELAVYSYGKKVHTVASGVHQLRQQLDGNLVAYSSTGAVRWAIGDGQPRSLTITNDGLHYSLTQENSIPIASWDIENGGVKAYLPANQVLFNGHYVQSEDKRYKLILQGDGNLVQYGPRGALWAVGANKGEYLIQQGDGKLVLYDYNGRPLWASTLWVADGAMSTTYVQGDGNIVTYLNYRPLWALR